MATHRRYHFATSSVAFAVVWTIVTLEFAFSQENAAFERNLRATHIPNTVSPDARAFLKRMKGNIVANYLIDSEGNSAALAIYRDAAPDMHIEETEFNGVKAYWFSSNKAVGRDAVVVYFHGGGYVVGDGKEDGGSILPVYEEVGVRGLSVDYRLAPAHPLPAAIEDAKKVYLGLLKSGYRPDQIALTGDSAGGALVFSVTLLLKQEGHPLPGVLAVISPGQSDIKVFGDTFETLADWDPFMTKDSVKECIEKYQGDLHWKNPLISPIYGNFEGFPPLLIQVGTRELILSDSVRLARKARREGVDVTLDVWEGMWHVWHITWPDVPEAREASKEMGQFIKRHLNLKRGRKAQ